MVTNSECVLPYYTAQSGSGAGMFKTTMGKLQRHLHKGEYDMFRYAPIFESDFIQITKRGEVIDVHNRVRMVTVGIACTSPILLIPDVMLLARPATYCEDIEGLGQVTKGKNRKAAKPLELTRLLPLKFVRISVHDREKQQLRLKFATGRSCYLQLCPPLDTSEDLFTYWEKLIYLLRPPVDSNSSTYATPAEDILCMPALPDEGRTSPTASNSQGKGDQDQVSIRSFHVIPEVTRTTSAAYAGGEGIQPGSQYSPTATPKVSTSKMRSTEFAKGSASETKTEVAIAGATVGDGAAVAVGTASGTASGTLSVAASKSGSGQVTAALAGAGAIGEGRSKSPVAGSDKAKSLSVAVAGTVTQQSEPKPPSASPKDSMSAAFAGGEATHKGSGEVANTSTSEVAVSKSPKDTEARQQGAPQASQAAHKERKERKKREKDKATSKGSRHHHHKTHEDHHKASGDKMARKSFSRSSSGRRKHRAGKKEKGSHRSARGSRHSRTPKGTSRTSTEKESKTSHKSRRSLSTKSSGSTPKTARSSGSTPKVARSSGSAPKTAKSSGSTPKKAKSEGSAPKTVKSSGSAPKRLGKFSSFLRTFRANLTTKGAVSLHGGDVDIVAKTVETTNVEAIVETAENGQEVEIVGSVTSAVIESVTVETH
ncbi:Golgi-associated RAB2 interactor protein 4 [Cavia porcellus]|uniref:Golgi-associated RAB2 interactor protein 4 n=1 Tax=Cavia porcellus TaxID=10141 RepID=UPI002FDF6DD2